MPKAKILYKLQPYYFKFLSQYPVSMLNELIRVNSGRYVSGINASGLRRYGSKLWPFSTLAGYSVTKNDVINFSGWGMRLLIIVGVDVGIVVIKNWVSRWYFVSPWVLCRDGLGSFVKDLYYLMMIFVYIEILDVGGTMSPTVQFFFVCGLYKYLFVSCGDRTRDTQRGSPSLNHRANRVVFNHKLR